MMAGTGEKKEGGAKMDMSLRLSMFLRSLLIQAAWNYQRMQNIGFVFALSPALRRAWPDPEKFAAAAARHAATFNTQPYMAGFILGNIARMEERAAAEGGGAAAEARIMGVRQALGSSLASIGDRIFWGRLRPLTAEVCMLVWLAAGMTCWIVPGDCGGVPAWVLLSGPAASVIFYSAVALYMRWTGLAVGYACGGSSSCGLDAFDWSGLIKRLSLAGLVVCAACIAAAAVLLLRQEDPASSGFWARLAVPVLAFAAQRAARRAGRSMLFTVSAVFAFSFAAWAAAGIINWIRGA
jgi:mannose/fructose/N-acetylgalactosamine-specific phosphotransferase system component IID